MSLAGKTVAFTGEMVGMTRKQAAMMAQGAGATVASATSKKIDFLFAGNGATAAKTMQAQANGVHVLSAPQFNQFTQGMSVPVMPQQPVVAAPVMPHQPVAAAPVMQYQPVMPQQPVAAHQPVGFPAVQYPAGTALKAHRVPRSAPSATQVAQPRYVEPVQFVPYVAATQPLFTDLPVVVPGKNVCFTGSFEAGNRAEVGVLAERAGAVVHPHVMPDTDVLVCGIAAHETKLAAAKQMGTRCVTEQQFTAAIAPAPQPTYVASPANFATATPTVPVPRTRRPRVVAAPLPPTPANSAPVQLAGQNVVFTGALQVNRVVAATMVTRAGGLPQPSLTSQTTLLVCGTNAGPKVAKAQAMGIRCVGEAEFVAACRV